MHPEAPAPDPVARAGPTAPWVATYLRVREREGRLYPDAAVRQLPVVAHSDPLHGEWRQRADSAARLTAYLARRPRPLSVLEVGCGNGWLAHRLAQVPDSQVIGLDANETELGQARRVFAERANVRFVLGDVRCVVPPAERWDVIVLASVIQYVPDLPGLLRRLAGWLRPGGELHLLDSPLYGPDELAGARARTQDHYAALGVPEMAAFYRHHTWRELDGFPAEVLYRPSSVPTRLQRRLLGRPRSPFPWIRIRPTAVRPVGRTR